MDNQFLKLMTKSPLTSKKVIPMFDNFVQACHGKTKISKSTILVLFLISAILMGSGTAILNSIIGESAIGRLLIGLLLGWSGGGILIITALLVEARRKLYWNTKHDWNTEYIHPLNRNYLPWNTRP